jgi:hypothetical protein
MCFQSWGITIHQNFHQTFTKTFTKLSPNFHQTFTKPSPNFHQTFTKLSGSDRRRDLPPEPDRAPVHQQNFLVAIL